MKTMIEGTVSAPIHETTVSKGNGHRKRIPFTILFAMVCALFFMDAVLPLRDLWFHEAQLTQLGSWPVWPSFLLFPGWTIIPPLAHLYIKGGPDIGTSWLEVLLLLSTMALVFLLYVLGLRYLPGYITKRYLFYSTLLLAILYMLIPVVTSPDIYSYIAYARIGVIHHLNPLTTLPTAIRSDEISSYILWVDQPSAYGPTWIVITSFMQWVFTLFGCYYILPMVIALRVFGLLTHLASTALVWSIIGHLQRRNVYISHQRRLRATLAFAWNPLLLLEACTNAHNDTTLLLCILLMVWFLVKAGRKEHVLQTSILAASMLALATCLKINIVLFAPGLLFYLWMQRPGSIKSIVAAMVTYPGIILVLYAPFWQGGAIFNVFSVNPATYRSINTLSDFAGHFYNGIVSSFGYAIASPIGSPAERFAHTVSITIFVLIYGILCFALLIPARRGRFIALWVDVSAPRGRLRQLLSHTLSLRTTGTPNSIFTIQSFIRWMALVWLLYCAIGSPWFWPWYIITFFGLYALLEGCNTDRRPAQDRVIPLAVRLLAFSMFSLYCFSTWGPLYSFVPGLPGFQWSYFSGLWAWILPVVALALPGTVRAFATVELTNPPDSAPIRPAHNAQAERKERVPQPELPFSTAQELD